jgi:hypothetical protein
MMITGGRDEMKKTTYIYHAPGCAVIVSNKLIPPAPLDDGGTCTVRCGDDWRGTDEWKYGSSGCAYKLENRGGEWHVTGFINRAGVEYAHQGRCDNRFGTPLDKLIIKHRPFGTPPEAHIVAPKKCDHDWRTYELFTTSEVRCSKCQAVRR